MRLEVTITYLELRPGDPQRLTCALPDGFALRVMPTPQPEVNRFLYTAVGGDWRWIDRLPWTYDEWARQIGQKGYETWLLTEGGSIAGYFELEPRADALNLAYFGLLRAYVGRGGLGGPLLSQAIQRAWERGAPRLTVNTCTMDHPAALSNYLARGFRPVRTETFLKEVPAVPHGPWIGSR